ncbi:hypothetical protein [Pseudomonas chlororaphis]|uniref:hypothetical protein n=1 Tax=Pseudomonas chlororaphis TaxID=587753 RepID=UPI001925F795|nr:hypothetical protein [Pseudomonas chlororaphis]QQX57084.1 hypothetical protein JHW28_21190 [Pseudomonas chlororaphis subsp. aurantiaca]
MKAQLFAREIALRRTHSRQINGFVESFVKAIKRNYISLHSCLIAPAVLRNLDIAAVSSRTTH